MLSLLMPDSQPEKRESEIYSIETVLQRLDKIGRGHQDNDGNLDHRYMREELGNKLGYIDFNVYTCNRIKVDKNIDEKTIDEMAIKGVRKILQMFPKDNEFIETWVQDSDALGEYHDDIFGKKADNS